MQIIIDVSPMYRMAYELHGTRFCDAAGNDVSYGVLWLNPREEYLCHFAQPADRVEICFTQRTDTEWFMSLNRRMRQR